MQKILRCYPYTEDHAFFLVVVTEAPEVAATEAPALATEAPAPATEGLLIEEVLQPQLKEVQPQPEEAALPREEEQTTEPLPFVSDIVEGKHFYNLFFNVLVNKY
jgi:hypothetical protein